MKFSAKAGCKIATIDDVKLAVRQQGLVAFEIFGATYGSGGIGRNDTDLVDVANSYFTTQLKTVQATVKVEHALASSSSASFFGTYGFLGLSVLFFCSSFFTFIRTLVSSHHKKSDKARPLLDSNSYSNSNMIPKDDETCSLNEKRYRSQTHDKMKQDTKVEPVIALTKPCNVPIHQVESNSVAQNSCMEGIHLHLNAIDGEQEGSGLMHDACIIIGESVHNAGGRFFKH
jgi:hypothetical protein